MTASTGISTGNEILCIIVICHSARYEYIAVYDTDEVIVPRLHHNWTELMSDLQRRQGSHDSWSFSNVYFFEDQLGLATEVDTEGDVPEYLHMFQYVYRSARYTDGHTKCFYQTEGVLIVHNHVIFRCLAQCRTHTTDQSLAHLHHYKLSCAPHLQNVCQEQYKNIRTDG